MTRDEMRRHVTEVAAIAATYENTILEIGNELPHHTQAEDLQDVGFLRDLLQYTHGIPTSLGADLDDESLAYAQYGDYATAHLDRGRDPWNQVRRVRELEHVSAETQKPVLNNEPLGAAEPGTPGQRSWDPAWFFCLGALNRLFEVVGVFHSQSGLHAQALGPRQVECATAYIRGVTVFPEDRRVTYKNATWHDSPVRRFDEGRAVRVYSGVTGQQGFTVVVGGNEAGVEWQNGWTPRGILGEFPGCRVYQIGR